MKQVQRLYSQKRHLDVSSQKNLFTIAKKLPRLPNKNSITRALYLSSCPGEEWKEGGVHRRVTSLGWFRQRGLYLQKDGLQFCDWNDNGVMATPGIG